MSHDPSCILPGGNHISRPPNSFAPEKPVDPNKVDLTDWKSFEQAREALHQAEIAKPPVVVVLLPNGRLDVAYEVRQVFIMQALQRSSRFVKAVLRGELPDRETTKGDRTVVHDVF